MMVSLKKLFFTLVFFLIMAVALIYLYGKQSEQFGTVATTEVLETATDTVSNEKVTQKRNMPHRPLHTDNDALNQHLNDAEHPSMHLATSDNDFNSVNEDSVGGVDSAEPFSHMLDSQNYSADTDVMSLDASRQENFAFATDADASDFLQSYSQADNIKPEHVAIIYQSEQTASAPAKAVLRQARQMTLDDREIIQGACWDYLNAVFIRAGVKRDTLFSGKYPDGPFINVTDLQVGDWLYYVNHSYHDIEHSGMFVGWVDESQNQALMLSYAGEHRKEPARYRVYDISHTYNVMRPVM